MDVTHIENKNKNSSYYHLESKETVHPDVIDSGETYQKEQEDALQNKMHLDLNDAPLYLFM